MRTTHFSFTVSNLERSIDFYCGILGLELIATVDRTGNDIAQIVAYPDAHLKNGYIKLSRTGDLQLELIEYVSPQGQPVDTATCNPGIAHICFAVDDIHSTYTRLREAGVRFKSEPVPITSGQNRGAFAVYFFDPDGITLELLQPAT